MISKEIRDLLESNGGVVIFLKDKTYHLWIANMVTKKAGGISIFGSKFPVTLLEFSLGQVLWVFSHAFGDETLMLEVCCTKTISLEEFTTLVHQTIERLQ